MHITEITHINVEITQFDNEDDRIDYYMSMGSSGIPVHWCNKQDSTTLRVYGTGEDYSIPGFLPFDISNPEESLKSFLKVLVLK